MTTDRAIEMVEELIKADFLGEHQEAVEIVLDAAKKRKGEGGMKSVVKEICAEYHAHLNHFPTDTPADFVSGRLHKAAHQVAGGRMDVSGLVFLSKCFGFFLKNYRMPDERELKEYDFRKCDGAQMMQSVVCILRTPDSGDEGGSENG